MEIITVFFKKFQSFLFKFIQTRIILIIITNCAVLLIVELSKIVKDTIESMNQAFLTQLYTIEGWLFEKVHDSFTFFEETLNAFKEKMESVMDVLLPDEFDIILDLIQFAAWLDLCIQALVSNTKNSIRLVVSQTVAPFLILTGELIEIIKNLTTAFTTIEQEINQTVIKWYEFIENQLTLAQTTYNGHINTFINSVDAGFSWYNEGVNAIETAAIDQKTIIEDYNQMNQGIINDILLLIGGTSGINQTMESITTLLNGITPVTTTPLNIDCNQYRLSLVTPQSFVFNPTMPDLTIDFKTARSCLIELETKFNSLVQDLSSIPQTLSDNFIAQFPGAFKSELIGELQALFVSAVTHLIIRKKATIMGHITGMNSDLSLHKTDIQLKIMKKAKDIIGTIETTELNLVKKIPNLLTPTVERYVEKVATAIEKAKEEISHEDINVIDFIPDLTQIEKIMATFEEIDKYKHQKPGKVSPLKHKFTIQDVYRLLCNNFFRSERLAILLALAPGDLQVETSDIIDSLMKLQK